MEKHLERIREEYRNYSLDESEATEERLNDYTKLAIFTHRTLMDNLFYHHEGGQFDENYVELSQRVTEGFCWDMEKIFETTKENACLELFKLGFFMVKKFDANMDRIRNAGYFTMCTKEGIWMPNVDEDSLFAEVFFAEKFKEITGRDLVAENREKVYGKK